jgi:hypothetical protein
MVKPDVLSISLPFLLRLTEGDKAVPTIRKVVPGLLAVETRGADDSVLTQAIERMRFMAN